MPMIGTQRLRVGTVTFLLLTLACTGQAAAPGAFTITDAAMCQSVSDDRSPQEITAEFPADSDQVYCWFRWENAKPNQEITARWYYATENLHILDFSVALTRISDQGVFVLRMPTGKTLPPGAYRVELKSKNKVLKPLNFSVKTPSLTKPAPADGP